MTRTRGLLVGTLLVFQLSSLGCSPASSEEAPLRSPTRDYPHPPTRTVDGQVLGADNVTPEEKLEQGPRAGTDGGALSPGWKADEKGLHYDPKGRTGGAVDQKPAEEH